MHRKTLPAALLAASLTCLTGCSALPPMLGEAQPAAATLTLDAFQGEGAACYDRASQPYTAVVDSHLHFRPFGGPALPFDEVVQYLENTGVRFANVYGIGQMLPVNSDCTYYLDCVGTLVSPTMKNDFVNAMNFLASGSDEVHLTMSMTFPDLEEPDSVLVGMRLLDDEFPGVFSWMGEVNLVKQALFGNFHAVVPLATIPRWAPFMAVLRFRGTPLAIHSDLGNDADPTQYLPWIEEVLRLYPHNKIVWMHLGLSRELVAIDPDTHIGILESLLDRYPNLMVDISWRVIDDNVFSDPELRDRYIPFLNAYSDRVLPGTDFVASANKNFDIYRAELDVTSRILGHLDDAAFRNIALGENYFRLMGLDYVAPEICASSS